MRTEPDHQSSGSHARQEAFPWPRKLPQIGLQTTTTARAQCPLGEQTPITAVVQAEDQGMAYATKLAGGG